MIEPAIHRRTIYLFSVPVSNWRSTQRIRPCSWRRFQRSGGLAFLAHPVDPPAPSFREPDISWEDWFP